MKRFLLLGAMAIALSGCVSDYPGYGAGYDPYPGVYEPRPVVVYSDRYRRPPVYRDYRPYRAPDRDYRRYDRRDDRRADFRRQDMRRPDNQPGLQRRQGSYPEIRQQADTPAQVYRPERAVGPRGPATRTGERRRTYWPPTLTTK